MKIRTKLIGAIVGAAMLCVAMSFLATQYFIRQIVRGTVGDYNTLLTEASMGSIDRMVYRRLESWESYVRNNSDLLAFLIASNTKFDAMKNRENFIQDHDSAWKALPVDVSDSFIQAITSNTLADDMRLRAQFYNDKFGYAIFPELFITNKYGVVVVANHKISDYLQADEEWWQKAHDEGVWMSDVSYDESSETYGLDLCVRINDAGGHFLGVIKVVYNIQDIFSVIDELKTSQVSSQALTSISRETVDVSLVNNNGQLIYSLNGGFGKLMSGGSLLEKIAMTTVEEQHVFVEDDNGTEKLFSRAKSLGYKDFKGLGWQLIISKNTSEAITPFAKELGIRVLYGVVPAVIFAAIFVFWMVWYFIFVPMSDLQEGIHVVRGGNLDHELQVRRDDEIGALANSFNAMTKSLKTERENIEKKIQERTAELEKTNKYLVDREVKMIELKRQIQEAKTESS